MPEALSDGSDKQKVMPGSQLHWFYCLVIFASLLLTLTAWYLAKSALEEKVAGAFEREALQVIELIAERMQKYEDALWAGVAAIRSKNNTVEHLEWKRFADALRVEDRYPGVNGIGVIHYVSSEKLADYLQRQRRDRPDYKIHPAHQRGEYWPITYIEPLGINAEALGLDMAHEANRYLAATKARDSAKAQITGPIVLVQDKAQTPGFLFFAPYYGIDRVDSEAERREHFIGLVYAPFIMNRLMQGTLEKEKRYIGIKISDGDYVLYDEHVASESDYDPRPLFTRSVSLDVYGRTWNFDLRSSLDFRASVNDHQPLVILIAGILINVLLLALFTLLTRANHHISMVLDKSEKKHREYIEASGDGYWDWYIQDDYEYMSPRFWQIFGYMPEEKPHKPSAWQDIVFEEDLKVALENFDKHVNSNGEYPYEQEVRYRHKSGSTVTVLCRGKVVEWDVNEQPIRMIGTHTDITYLKNIENKLREVKEQYDLAVQGSSVGLWDWDIINNTLYWSGRFKSIIGIDDENYKPSLAEFQLRLHPDNRQGVIDAVKAHLEKEDEYDVEYRLRHSDGHYIWIHERGQAVWDGSGEPVRMAGSIDDITASKDNAIALKKALEFQKLLVNVNTDLVFVKDEQFRIVEANSAFISLYPAERRDKVIGYTTIEDYDIKQAEEFLAEDKKAFSCGESEVIETIDFPDGVKRILLTKKLRFKDINNDVFILGISRDITKLKQTEDSLVRANSELEEFAYRTSHDLRSPLISSARLLDIIRSNLQKGDIEKSVDYIDIVRESLKKLEALVSDILTMTRVNHSEPSTVPVDIKTVITESLEKFSHMNHFDRIKVTVEYGYDGEIMVQREHFTLVIENLLSNAIKYQDLDKNVSFLNISTQEQRGSVTLTIVDNGLGIPEKSRGKLFTMFKRFHPNTAFGSGLGLYMVKKSVDKMKGHIEYQSLDEGTSFVVTIPIKS